MNLKHLVNYVMKVYSPGWFSIKMHLSCKDGTRHLFKTMQQSHYLSKELRYIVNPVLHRNGYFGHPENLLLAMISDERQYIRELVRIAAHPESVTRKKSHSAYVQCPKA